MVGGCKVSPPSPPPPLPTVATLATANAVVEGMDIESERDSHSDIPNHAPLDPPEPSLSLPLPARRRTKRTRTAFSQSQLDALELAFHANPYPDGFYRQKVSRHVGIAEDRIQVCINQLFMFGRCFL